MKISLLEYLTTTHRDAVNIAPVQTGNLVSSGRIEPIVEIGDSLKGSVVFGSEQVPYAKKRHYENKKNPQTKGYLEKAGDKNARNFVRYLKGKHS